MATFKDSVDKFKSSAPWLGDEDAPALAALDTLAETIDGGRVEAALISQFGLTYRSLVKRAPAKAGDRDELGGLLDDLD